MRMSASQFLLAALLLAAVDARETAVRAAPVQAPAAGKPPAASSDQVFSREQLDQMMAPVALYPDSLLAQVLMASTYPGDVADAVAWSKAHKDAKGEDAVRYGIGHILAEDAADLETKCAEVLAQISLCAPGANATTKRILFEATRRPRPDALDFAARGFAACMLSEEGREGMAAFIEKRKPRWANE